MFTFVCDSYNIALQIQMAIHCIKITFSSEVFTRKSNQGINLSVLMCSMFLENSFNKGYQILVCITNSENRSSGLNGKTLFFHIFLNIFVHDFEDILRFA